MNRDMSGSVRGLIDDMLSGSVAGNVKVETSGGSTVTITPTLESGTKIADFTIDDTSGVLYAPTPEPPIEYTAGANINISDKNVISATDTTYTAGNNITIENGVISASGGSGINYSTDEQIIGKWIDGTNLYRKVYTGLDFTPIYNSWSNIISSLPQNFKNLIKVDLMINTGSNGYNDLTASGLEITHSIIDNTIRIESNQSANIRPINIFAIIYTKTTD